jgi:hypothetical protein
VELVEREMVRKRIEIRGNAAGLRAGRRIGQALAPSAAIEGDDTIAFPSEGGRLGLPPSSPAGARWLDAVLGSSDPESYTKFPRRWKGHDLPLMDQVGSLSPSEQAGTTAFAR